MATKKSKADKRRKVALRRALRQVLSTGRREQTAWMIENSLEVLGYEATELDVVAAVDWNMGEALVARRHDAEREEMLYRLTDLGREREGII